MSLLEHVLFLLYYQVEYFDVGTPASNNHYLASPKGEIYGLDHTARRFGSPEIVSTLRPDTDIPGLLLTGKNGEGGGGGRGDIYCTVKCQN